jgi:hypothetical protein
LILSAVASSSVYADDNEVKKDILYVGDEDNDQLQAFDTAMGDFKETLAPATAGILGPRGLISVMNNLPIPARWHMTMRRNSRARTSNRRTRRRG